MAGKIKALLTWCQNNTTGYKDVKVVNMTTSWKDGLAFCALIHHFRPDLIDFDSLSKENILHNNRLAFQTAENELGIAALLDAEDMVAMKVPDKLSIITYVSQYYNCLHDMEPMSPLPKVKAPKRSASPVSKPQQVEVKKKPLLPEVNKTKPPLISSEKPQTFSSCEICRKKVHLVERFIDEGKVYHRQCHRTKSLSGMYKRSAVPPLKLPDSAKAPARSPDVAKDKQTKVETRTSSDPPTSTAPSSPSTNTKPNSDRTSKVLAMSQIFESKSKESLGLKTNVDHSWNIKSPETTVNVNPNITADKKASSSVENPPKVENQAEPTVKILSQKSDGQFSVSQTTDNKKSSRSHEQKQDLKTEQGIESKSENKAEEELPSMLKSLADAKQKTNVSASSEQKTPSPNIATTDDDKAELFPSLLESLVDVQKGDAIPKSQMSNSSNDTSPTTAFAPLISELPKVPEAKSRSRTTSSEKSAALQPSARNRSNESNNKHFNEPYDDELNPFGAPDTLDCTGSSIKQAPDRPPYDVSLNPFGDEICEDESDSQNAPERPNSLAPAKSTNPFDEEDDVVPELNSDVKSFSIKSDSKSRTGTVNIVNPNDSRLNPFTNEYEDRKETPNPPMPPVRRKTRAPTPPKGSTFAEKTVASSAHAKRSAPAWKSDVEKKMEQLNELNQTDVKFVEKTSDTNLSVKSTKNGTPVQKPNKELVKKKRLNGKRRKRSGYLLEKAES